MTYPFFTRYLPLAMTGVLLLSGCSSAPSTSEAQQAVEAALGECAQVEVANFEKVNGIANGDSNYTLQVKYSLKFSPLETSTQTIQQLHAFFDEQKQKLQQTEEFIADIDAKQKAGLLKPGENEDPDHGPYYVAMTDYQFGQNYIRGYPFLLKQRTAEVRQVLANNLMAACPSLPRYIAKDYGNADIESFGDTIQIDYTNDSLLMVKSDNGWIGN
ncbi:hypothetical protein [Vogesella indigofera]|uniref:hypothetical protein n=1 Tax=Vogesella indigofera TaxID=45465 RepID=UPI00234E601C|nr:hypothetical protein [Vogesella indigofera]MDC7712346.1 hypothetical protein [Vogesella indigofera]